MTRRRSRPIDLAVVRRASASLVELAKSFPELLKPDAHGHPRWRTALRMALKKSPPLQTDQDQR